MLAFTPSPPGILPTPGNLHRYQNKGFANWAALPVTNRSQCLVGEIDGRRANKEGPAAGIVFPADRGEAGTCAFADERAGTWDAFDRAAEAQAACGAKDAQAEKEGGSWADGFAVRGVRRAVARVLAGSVLRFQLCIASGRGSKSCLTCTRIRSIES
jgi:hypothetical protein